MIKSKTFKGASDSIDAVMLLCTIIKDFFSFLNELGVALPFEAKRPHLEAYKQKLIEQGMDDTRIAYTITAIRQFYADRLNHPLTKQ